MRMTLVALLLALATQPAWSDAPPASRGSSVAGAFVESEKTALDALARRIDLLAITVERASQPPPPIDPWQDAKSVVLNIVSSRLDAWLFGDGKDRVGRAAQLAAALAFVIALARLILAIALLNPKTPDTPWGRFKKWTRQSAVVRAINVVIGLLAVVFTGTALYVVTSARSAPAVTEEAVAALRESLKACESRAVACVPQDTGPPSSLPISAGIVRGAVQDCSTSCVEAIRATDVRLTQIENLTTHIDGKQPSAWTKMMQFVAWSYLLGVATYLLVQSLSQ
jgi:hypothetical protein